MRQASLLVWFGTTMLVLDLGARLVCREESLLSLRVPSAATSLFVRRQLARRARGVATVVVGNSTGERGIDACAVGDVLGAQGLNLALPGGGFRQADSLLADLAQSGNRVRRVLFVTSSINFDVSSPSMPLTWKENADQEGYAPAVLGTLSGLFGNRDRIRSLFQAQFNRRTFASEIEAVTPCGLSIWSTSLTAFPPAAQLEAYDKMWLLANRRPPSLAAEQGVAQLIRAWAPARVSIVFAPMRRDFVEHLDRQVPGLRESMRAAWQRVLATTSASVIDCERVILDDGGFYDPIHLNPKGRSHLDACVTRAVQSSPPGRN